MQARTSIDIFRYWQTLRRGGTVPSRVDIDPGAIRHGLGDVFILEDDGCADGKAASPRFRLAGTRICSLFVRELRGARFDSLWSATDFDRLADLTETVLAKGRPATLRAHGRTAEGETLAIEILLLPLRSRDGRIDRIFGSLTPLAKPAWIGTRALPFLVIDTAAFLDLDTTPTEVPVRATVSRSFTAPVFETPLRQVIARVMHLSVLEGGKGR